ncbi:two-component regulator propeller domain-containing protein [Reichenbachiella sp.]|uniref:sensor histidine kinase n=1 Tax=Reichenbachiella sp. TaxID=2184521 RepID=UPI003B5932B4
MSSTIVLGQLSSFDPDQSIDNISLKQWTNKDGLPSNNTNSVFQDSEGLIWVTSYNGFMIYDGERVDSYDKNRLSFLKNDGFYNIAQGHDGVIYIASNGDGIVKYENGLFSSYKPRGGTVPRSVRRLFIASDSSLYIGSNHEGLFRVMDDSLYKVEGELFGHAMIRSITEDDNHNIWFGTEGGGLNRVGKDGFLHFGLDDGILSNNVLALLYRENKLFMGTAKGLQSMDLGNDLALQEIPILEDHYINTLLVDHRGSLWIGTEAGVARWIPQSAKIEWLYSKHDIDLVRINGLHQDEENQIWMSSNRSGLVQIKGSKVINLSEPELSSTRINMIHESWDGNYYIGTDGNIIDVYDGDKINSLKVQTELHGNGIRDIYHDTDGSIWLATYVGIIHIKEGKERVYSELNGMPANDFRRILKDSKGNFWFCTRSGGLVKFREGKVLQVYSNGNGLESNFVLAVEESANGDIYVGTFSGGLTIIKPNGDCKTHHVSTDDSGLVIFNVDFDSKKSAFVTANSGLLYFDGENLERVKLQSDQRSNTFFDLIIDDYDHMWLTTNLGVLQIQKSNWEEYRAGEVEHLSYFIVDQSSGMNTEECTGATRSTKLSNGHISVPTLGGVVFIDPFSFDRDVYIPKVKIRQMIADDEMINIEEAKIQIGPGTSRYRFDFCVLSFSSPDRNQFKYKLEGYDKGWSAATYEGTVEYTNLSPGDYTIRVMGTNDSHVWNEEGDALTFTVDPFYYETTWFFALCIIIVLSTIFLFFSWRVAFINNQNRELRKVNAELDRFVYSASHEMRSPLSSILGLINVASLDKTPNKEEYLAYIKNSVERLDSLLQDIVDHSKNARTELEITTLDLRQEVEDVIEGLTYSENFPKIEPIVECNGDGLIHSDANRLKIVLNNLITNAYKHHSPDDVSNPFVKVVIDNTEAGIKLTIADNGPGIPLEEQEKVFNMFYRATHKSDGTGLGLYIVKEIITNLKGSIEVHSEVGKGTTFLIELVDLRN